MTNPPPFATLKNFLSCLLKIKNWSFWTGVTFYKQWGGVTSEQVIIKCVSQPWWLRGLSNDNVQIQLPLLSWWIESHLRHLIYGTVMDRLKLIIVTPSWSTVKSRAASSVCFILPFQRSQHREQSQTRADRKKIYNNKIKCVSLHNLFILTLI